jgi:putative AdoMet-dependent methyltransferase
VVSQSRFPFAGYERVLDTVVELASPTRGMTVLDLGTGTGNLALRFAAHGCRLWCTDFSAVMLEAARAKLPKAQLVLHDLGANWPAELDRRFDRIVSAYVFHHFELKQKLELINELARERLAASGQLIIADISFPDQESMRRFAQSAADVWEEEAYWRADESVAAIRKSRLKVSYVQVSDCAGVYCVERDDILRPPN